MADTIPYTVIGGYLGAGKTTLLNNLLRNSQGLRLAVLVNDFGDINIDADLITSHDGETINLASGCICCSLADGFMLALNRISKRGGEIDHIVVEASGVADPAKIGHYGAVLKLDLQGVIVLADAEQIRERAANKYVGDTVVRQLQGADLIVLNKVDLVTPTQLASVRSWLADIAAGAHIVEAVNGQLPLSVLLGTLHDPTPAGEERPGAHAPSADHAPGAEHEEEDGPVHDSMYQTWSFIAETPFDRVDLLTLLESLGEGTLRAKGFVQLADDPGRRYLLQLVGRRWKLTPGEIWGAAIPQTRLVFISLRGTTSLAEITRGLRGPLPAAS